MRSLLVSIAVLTTLVCLAACGSANSRTSTAAGSRAGAGARAASAHRFDVEAAWRLVKLQLRYGQRPAGSAQLRALAQRLRPRLPAGHYEAIPGEPKLRNVVGTLKGRRPGLLIGAHYDTLVKPEGFVGANNGAAGSALVVQLGRELRRLHRPRRAREIRFVLFDGEEPAGGLPEEDSDFYNHGLRGSRAYVAAHAGRTREMVLLDYVGNKGLRLPREANSDEALWARLRSAARAVGAGQFFPEGTGTSIIDDHTPFLRASIPAIDLIDWSYEGHDVSDTLDKLSKRSLDAVGETLVELVRRTDAADAR
jgi:Zn-dependent M28 family amino/carboxypeptidase